MDGEPETDYTELISKQMSCEEIMCKAVTHKNALEEFISNDWDFVFYITEPGFILDKTSNQKWKNGYKIFKDIEKSKLPNQSIYRLGFISEEKAQEEGGTPFIELPVSPENLKEIILK